MKQKKGVDFFHNGGDRCVSVSDGSEEIGKNRIGKRPGLTASLISEKDQALSWQITINVPQASKADIF